MMNTSHFFQTRWLALVPFVFLAACSGGSGGGCGGNCTVPAFHTPPVTISKVFTPSSIVPGGTSKLSITLANSTTGSSALSGVAISDALPTGITIAATPNATTTCTSGTVTATAGSGTVSLAGASLAAGASCTIGVNVTGVAAGSYTNTIPASALTSTQGATNTAPATATLTITAGPNVVLSKSFAPSTIPLSGTSTLTISVANTAVGAVPLTGLTLTDSLPASVVISSAPNAFTTCGAGTVSAVAGGTSVGLSGGSVAPGATCAIRVNVTGATAGSYLNTIPASALTSTQGATNTAPATATLTISAIVVSSCSQGAGSIALGAAAPFAILAGSTVTNVGNTLVTYAPGAVTSGVNDDLIGVWPGTAVTGFYPPGTDADGTGAIYAAGYNTNTAVPMAAQGALTTAYNAAAGVPATATVAGDLGGQTLAPGVYKSTSTLAIANGNLTLDGGGNPQSVFIFQVGSTLTTVLNGGAGGNVILQNNASACNIYWQIGSSATLGGATFYGNVLAYSSITINASTFTGRALAGGSALGTGAVSIPVAGGSLITNPGGQ